MVSRLHDAGLPFRPAPRIQCKHCFMTGKACIYQREIKLDKERIAADPRRESQAFMIMPFRSTLDEVYRSQLEPCLLKLVGKVQRGDDVSRTGYVMCEKICKQIQLASLVCAEISCDNPNVFYELGLAYALERDAILFMQQSVAQQRSDLARKLSIEGKYNVYQPFEMLEAKTLTVWEPPALQRAPHPHNRVAVLLADTTEFTETVNGRQLRYTVDGLCSGLIGRTLDSLHDREVSPWGIDDRDIILLRQKGYRLDNRDATFDEIAEKVRKATTVIVVTHVSEPCSYFWLGFAHGLEKDVIPITVEPPRPASESRTDPAAGPVRGGAALDMLPFDMRALWHISLCPERPRELEPQLSSIIEVICGRNKDKRNRVRFWRPFIDEGSTSIFVGSVELTPHGRHVIGDGDYRAVAELTSFFVSVKETMAALIQAPTFQGSKALMNAMSDERREEVRLEYVASLLRTLDSGNCIVLGSADVNDLTEVALATYAGVAPFVPAQFTSAAFSGVVAFKYHELAAHKTPSLYFQGIEHEDTRCRGFYHVCAGGVRKELTFPYEECDGYSVFPSHVAKMQLPGSKYWTMVLQGTTGPATLGLTQALTGGINKQFTVFSPEVDADRRTKVLGKIRSRSESLQVAIDAAGGSLTLEQLHRHSETLTQELTRFKSGDAVEAIVNIYVMNDGGERPDTPSSGQDGVSGPRDDQPDQRKIIWWDIVQPARQMVRP